MSDEGKLVVFEQAFIRLRDALRAWVAEGFELYLAVVKKPALAVQQLHQYLEPRLGQQIPQQQVAHDHVKLMPPWFHAKEGAHPVIVWWTAEASAGEGDQFFGRVAESPDELPATDAQMLADIDPALAQWWFPPTVPASVTGSGFHPLYFPLGGDGGRQEEVDHEGRFIG